MVGKTISHYKVLEKIGQGGMGEVYLAEDSRLDRNIVLNWFEELKRRVPTNIGGNMSAKDHLSRYADGWTKGDLETISLHL